MIKRYKEFLLEQNIPTDAIPGKMSNTDLDYNNLKQLYGDAYSILETVFLNLHMEFGENIKKDMFKYSRTNSRNNIKLTLNFDSSLESIINNIKKLLYVEKYTYDEVVKSNRTILKININK